jgi:hypothetical protein
MTALLIGFVAAPFLVSGLVKTLAAKTCRGCIAADAEVRRDRITAMWEEGMSVLAIAREFGCTRGAITVEMAYIRELGRDLPYRYRNTKRQRAAA